jgi:hypothetical protein
MPFYVASSDSNGNIVSGTLTQLSPGPTYVSYPDKFYNVVRTAKDGSAIIQTPLVDGRPRHWVWKNYKQTVPNYNQLYQQLLQYHYKWRLNAGSSPWVYVQDTETLNLEYQNLSAGTWVETANVVQVKVTQVTQNLLPQSGLPSYDLTFSFIITDQRYQDF